MKPTQAQIEVAAKVLNSSYENMAYSRKVAKAALAAAAEVGEQKDPYWCYSIDDINGTIERCAQKCEALAKLYSDKREAEILIKAAAAIRALKHQQT